MTSLWPLELPPSPHPSFCTVLGPASGSSRRCRTSHSKTTTCRGPPQPSLPIRPSPTFLGGSEHGARFYRPREHVSHLPHTLYGIGETVDTVMGK